jgi:phenylacetate-CoA ligase
MIWDEKHECMDRESMENLQLQRLQQLVHRIYDRVPHYRQALEERGILPGDIQSLEDLRHLPFTGKEELRQNYPYGLFAVPMQEVVRVHASSGTTGKPTVVGYTQKDIATWTELIARIVTQAGVTNADVAQVCFSYGLFTGAFGLHYGLEKVGATVVPASAGNTAKQILLMRDFGTTALISTPSYALYLAEAAGEAGIDPRDLNLKVGLFGGEPWTENMGHQIESLWGIKATDNYGLSEVMGPGVSGECLEGAGLHISEDHFLVEVIDPETGEPLPYGEKGELVFTTLTKEAFPVLRYRTRDLAILTPGQCACGRTSVRMCKVMGRTDDMLIIRGVNVFPSQIESVLMDIRGIAPHYLLIVDTKGPLNQLEVQVEPDPAVFTGNFRDLEALEDSVRRRLQSVLSIGARVKLVEPKTLQRTAGKAQRIRSA